MQAQYEFEETQSHVRYTVPLKGTSSKNVDVYYSPVHMKINFAPYFLLIDFPERVENEKHGVSLRMKSYVRIWIGFGVRKSEIQ